jgi:1-acyl-sn-glycerol-3-phosphate acyltransferase
LIKLIVLIRFFMGCWMLFVGILCTIFYGSLVIILSPFSKFYEKNGESLHKIAEVWARSVMFLNPWWKYSIFNAENIPKNIPVVLVANHQSQTDILALYLLKTQFRWLSKESMFKFPILGSAMRKIGYIGVVRGDSQSQVKCMKESAERLRNGLSMAFFPEGTRSKDGHLLKFKVGAFKLAKEHSIAIVPVSICGTHKMLPKGTMLPQFSLVKITVHKPIETKDYSVEQLIEKSRLAITQGLTNAG